MFFVSLLLVIPPEIVKEVEARMKRTIYLPQRKHRRPQLPTVQEQGR